jgi:hypothetical protein
VAAVANQIAPFLHRGDVVVVTQTEQLAVVAHYLPAGVEYVTPTGPVNDPYVVDWRNLVHRLQLATPCQAVAPVVNAAPAGTQIVEIDPAKRLGASGTSWSKAVNSQVLAINALLASDPSLTEETTAAPALRPRPFSPVSATVYMKHGGVGACR